MLVSMYAAAMILLLFGGVIIGRSSKDRKNLLLGLAGLTFALVGTIGLAINVKIRLDEVRKETRQAEYEKYSKRFRVVYSTEFFLLDTGRLAPEQTEYPIKGKVGYGDMLCLSNTCWECQVDRPAWHKCADWETGPTEVAKPSPMTTSGPLAVR